MTTFVLDDFINDKDAPALWFAQAQDLMEDDAPSCTLCADGSPGDLSLSTTREEGWTCNDLNIFATTILKEDDMDCHKIRVLGFQDCACPTFPGCNLCPNGFFDIPDPTVAVPSPNGLTCADILFVEPERLPTGQCSDLSPYRELCGCPTDSECSFCADGSAPTEQSRVLPYLSTPSEPPVTCGQVATMAFSSPPGQCADYTVAPVPVNGQGYCGCQGTFPSNLCTMCPDGAAIVNPDFVVPNTQGMTCSEVEEYLQYITDEDSCNAIAASAQVCCKEIVPCPVCSGNFNEDKLYEPYSLTCSYIGNAQDFGHPMTCEDVQLRFPYFCECPGALPTCTLCQLGELPPETDKEIPLLGTTCKSVNDYASLRTVEDCAEEIAFLSFDASAYCGCTGFEPPALCEFCPESQLVTNPDLAPEGASGATCGDLEDFADFVTTANLCSAVQAYAVVCCRDPGAPTVAPSVGFFPGTPTTATPTITLAPTSVNETLSPTFPGQTTGFPTGGFVTFAPTSSAISTLSLLFVPTIILLVATTTVSATMGSWIF